MNRRVAFPFLTFSDTAVETSAWEVSVDGVEWSMAGEFLPNWDSASGIRLRRAMRLNPELAASDPGIPVDQLAVGASVRIGTGQGRLPRLQDWQTVFMSFGCALDRGKVLDLPLNAVQLFKQAKDLLCQGTFLCIEGFPELPAGVSPAFHGTHPVICVAIRKQAIVADIAVRLQVLNGCAIQKTGSHSARSGMCILKDNCWLCIVIPIAFVT